MKTTSTSQREQLFQYWLEQQSLAQVSPDSYINNDQIEAQCYELIDLMIKNLEGWDRSNLHSIRWSAVIEVIDGISMLQARRGFSPRETAALLIGLKEALLRKLQDDITGDALRLYEEGLALSRLMEHFVLRSFEVFIKAREEVISGQSGELSEISLPVIRVWDNIIAMPIVGTLDSERTQTLMEVLLLEIAATGSTVVILDISGVPTIDTLVAQHLIKTAYATRLMGSECIISGIKPEIAQTITHLNIDLSGVITKPRLADALQYAFRTMELVVGKKTV